MTNTELLREVKTSLNITGTYQDNVVQSYINEVLEYLKDSGLSDTVLQSDSIVGVVTRGVSDLWAYGGGTGELSNYFMQRATQLSYYVESGESESTSTPTELTKVCTITDKADSMADSRDNGIYQKGSEYYIQLISWFTATRDSNAGWNINIGQIDDSKYYPPMDLFYNCLYNDSGIATLKVWTTGLITLLPTVDVKTGDFIMISHSGEYGGVVNG